MTQELLKLREHITNGQYHEALLIVDELDDMSRKAIIRNIRSFLVRLMINLIKNQVEKRLTNSWAASIRSSILEIQDLNLQGNRKSYYIKQDDWQPYIEESYEDAIYSAASEVFSGRYHPLELMTMLEREQLYQITHDMLADTCICNRRSLSKKVNARLAILQGGEKWDNYQ